MDLQTIIFIGRSGCGKGTQAKLLGEYLKAKDAAHPVRYLETGDKFREFIAKDGYSSRLSRAILERSDLQPPFLAIHFWSDWFVDNLTGGEHLIVDGTPRYLDEARALTGAMQFYARTPIVLHLDVPREFSEKHLRERGRADDKRAGDIEKRLAWFETSVVPAIEYIKQEPTYRYVRINGDQPIEKVHAEILSALS
ncbi:nucleoside monophosphate kinase [Candidatus Parcubacteria bacterium]|nr:nucleoside monophosphate kinase [Candidatus Parcubacteria bacterium]